MKNQFSIKNWITFTGLMSLYLIVMLVIVTILIKIDNEDTLLNIFTTIFTLFTNVITAVITFFFTRKSIDSTHSEIEDEAAEEDDE